MPAILAIGLPSSVGRADSNIDQRPLFTQQPTLGSCRAMPEKCLTGPMHRKKFVLFAASLPRLSIGCAITGLIASAVSNHAGMPADVGRTPIPR